MEKYGLHSKFDIDKHDATFINYLEIIVKPDGEIEYAVPSHQEKLISIACQMKNITRQELVDICPREYYFDTNRWLCILTGCISIHTEVFYPTPNITDKQKEIMTMLQQRGYALREMI